MSRWRWIFLACFLLIWSCSAQSQALLSELSQAPKCAITCISEHLGDTKCSLNDLNCLCNDNSFISPVKSCVLLGCDLIDALQAQNVLSHVCTVPVRNESATVQGIAIAFAVPALAAVIIRIYLRQRGAGWLGADDILIILASILIFPITAAVFVLVSNGLGKDLWGVPIGNVSTLLHWYFVSELLYICVTSLTKMSVLCFYLRVFPDKGLRRNAWITLGLATAAWISFLFAVLFQCSPVSTSWTVLYGPNTANCDNVKAGFYAQAGVTIALDIPVILIPVPAVLKLHLPLRRKIGLIVVFSLGLLTTVVSALRFHALVVFQYSDFTYGLVAPTYWSVIEINVGILCVCLPTIRPFFRAIGRKFHFLTTLSPSRTGKSDSYPSYNLSDRPRYESATVDSEHPKASIIPKNFDEAFAVDRKSGVESSRPDSSTIGIPYARNDGGLSRLESVLTRETRNSYSNVGGTRAPSRQSQAARDSLERTRRAMAMSGLSPEGDHTYSRGESDIPSGFTSTAPRDSSSQPRTTMGGIDSMITEDQYMSGFNRDQYASGITRDPYASGATREHYASGSESIPIGYDVVSPEESYHSRAADVSRMPSINTYDTYDRPGVSLPSAFDSMPPPPLDEYERSEVSAEGTYEPAPSSQGVGENTQRPRVSTGYTYQPTKQLGLFIPSYQK